MGETITINETLAWTRLFRLLPGLTAKAEALVAAHGSINNAWALSAVADEIAALRSQIETLTIQNAGLTRFAIALMEEDPQADGANGNDQG